MLGSIISRVSRDDPFITIARQPGATASPQNIYFTYMSGGENNTGDAPVSTQDYIDALYKLEQEAIGKGIILVQSTSQAVHAAVSAWVKSQRENDNGRWHVFVGHPHDEVVADVAARCHRLNTIDVTMASPGVKIYDQNDVLQTYDSTYYAAIMAGQYAGSGLDQPLTNNTIPIDELVTKYDIDAREVLIQSGCTVAKFDKSRSQFVTSYGLTTYTQTEQRFYRVLFPKGAVDHVEWNIKTIVEQRFKGRKARVQTPGSIASLVTSLLSGFETIDEILVRNPGDPSSQAFSPVSVDIQGGICLISFSSWFTDELDFFSISQKANLQRLQSTVQANLT